MRITECYEKWRMNNINNRTIILVLSVVLIAAVLSGCVQDISEIGAPDATPPAPTSEVTSHG